MIRQSDPGVFHLVLPTYGQRVLAQDRKEALVQPSDLVFYDTSRPSQLSAAASNSTIQGITVLIPRTLISLPSRKVKDLTATSFSGRVGVGALLSQFLNRLSISTDQYKETHAAHLGMILIDLLTTLLDDVLDSSASSPQPRQLALLAQVQAFIQRQLADPALGPDMIAAAHHISTRSLQQLFQDHELTVSGWIKQCRLERCQRDLANPLLETRPIHAIAERWGFISSAHFSRVFRTTYGVAPSDYRRLTRAKSAAAA